MSETHAPHRPSASVTPSTRAVGYRTVVPAVLVAAYTLSVVHTVYAWLSGLSDPRFTVTTPVAWVFYAVAFGTAVLARREARWAAWTVAVLLVAAVAVAVFFYPTTFTPAQQTTFGWFENDVYTGLLILALFLVVLRLRRTALVDR